MDIKLLVNAINRFFNFRLSKIENYKLEIKI